MARDATAVLEDLVKLGRGFGIHVLLSSQSPAVAGAFLKGITNQMGLRIALACLAPDSMAILGEGNSAASELETAGEAIVNKGLGRREANTRIRVAFLSREAQQERLAAIAALPPRRVLARSRSIARYPRFLRRTRIS